MINYAEISYLNENYSISAFNIKMKIVEMR